MLREFLEQAHLIDSIAHQQPQLLQFEMDESGAIIVDESATDPNIEVLLREIEDAMACTRKRDACGR